jgi:hypothetical protein
MGGDRAAAPADHDVGRIFVADVPLSIFEYLNRAKGMGDVCAQNVATNDASFVLTLME